MSQEKNTSKLSKPVTVEKKFNGEMKTVEIDNSYQLDIFKEDGWKVVGKDPAPKAVKKPATQSK